ncbi:MAG: phosphonate ABC transporter, permease protein PhnE [Elsteraceae bacterium]
METPLGVAQPNLDALNRRYEAATVGRRRRFYWLMAGVALAASLSSWVAEVDLGLLWRKGDGFFSYFQRIFTFDSGDLRGKSVFSDPAEWFWGLKKWLLLLLDTLLIAFLGTLLGTLGALSLCFAAARNLTPNRWVASLTKRALEFCRTVPEVVFALIFVIAFGLGPLPGVLALALHSMGALGKLFAETAENIDPKPIDGVTAAGGSWTQIVAFAAMPQVISVFVSNSLLRFEINVRSASVMGFVGAGGIGQTLLEAIRKFYYADVSAILMLILATVMLIDSASGWLRRRLLDAGKAA